MSTMHAEDTVQCLTIENKDALFFVPYSHIRYIESSHRTLSLYTKERPKPICFQERFCVIEEALAPYGFFCTRKGTLLNLAYVTEIQKGTSTAYTSFGVSFPISRLRKKELLSLFHTICEHNPAKRHCVF